MRLVSNEAGCQRLCKESPWYDARKIESNRAMNECDGENVTESKLE